MHPFERDIPVPSHLLPVTQEDVLPIPPGVIEDMIAANGALFRLRPAEQSPPGPLEPSPATQIPEDVMVFRKPATLSSAWEDSRFLRDASLNDSRPYRLWAAHRLTVELGRHLNHPSAMSHENRYAVGEDEFLFEVTNHDLLATDAEAGWSAWDLPRPAVPSTVAIHLGAFGTRSPVFNPRIAHRIGRLVRHALTLPTEATPWVESNAVVPVVHFRHGLPLRPPPVPRHLEGDPDYDPFKDQGLLTWMAAIQEVAEHLNLPAGTLAEPQAGTRALHHLFHPSIVRLAWPTPRELIQYEEEVVDTTKSLFVRFGSESAEKYLKQRMGYTTWETRRVLTLVRHLLADRANESLDVSKGLAIAKLEDLQRRAADSLDLRAELGAIKAQAVVQGVARAEVQDEVSAFKTVSRGLPPASRAKEDMPLLPEP